MNIKILMMIVLIGFGVHIPINSTSPCTFIATVPIVTGLTVVMGAYGFVRGSIIRLNALNERLMRIHQRRETLNDLSVTKASVEMRIKYASVILALGGLLAGGGIISGIYNNCTM